MTQQWTPSVLYRAVLLAFALVVAGTLFQQLKTLLIAILIVVIFALPLSAFADLLERWRIPRAIGALVGLLLLIGLIAGFVTAIVPTFTDQINAFAKSLPHIVESLRQKLGQLTGTSSAKIAHQLRSFIDGYTQHPNKLLGPLESVGASVATVLGAIIVALLTALYIAIRPDPLVRGAISIFPPGRRPLAQRILGLLRAAYLGWLRGLLTGMIVLGGLTYLGLRIVGLDFAGFFAIFTAVAMIVPYFGALLSALPPVLYAITISPQKAILVGLIYVIAHQLEGNVIQPQVVARAVELHPAVVAIGVLAVDALFGFVGLIVAVPILSTVKILVQELWIAPQEAQAAAAGLVPGAGTSTVTPLPRPPTARKRIVEAEQEAEAQTEEQRSSPASEQPGRAPAPTPGRSPDQADDSDADV